MIEVIASVLPFTTFEELKNKIATLRGVVPVIQIDLCDGVFVPSQTWPFTNGGFEDYDFQRIMNEEIGLPLWEEFDFELDLMVADAVQNFDIYMKLGAKRMIFHVEAMESIEEFRNFLEGIDLYIRDSVEIGIAFRPNMPLEDIYPLVSFVDFVQFMGNDQIGVSGVSLDERTYERVRTFRAKYPELPIEVDIGITEETAPLLVDAGATKLITGSVLFKAYDKIGLVERFQNL